MREAARAAGAKRCPICGKPAAEKFSPFCGKRCTDVDLNRWLSGVYAVPAKEGEDDDGVPTAPDPSDDPR